MIWHHIMFSLAGLIGAQSSALERLGRIARGLGGEIHLFDCLYDPDVVAEQPPGVSVNSVIQARVKQRRREVELWADALRAQATKVRVSVHWDYPAYEAIVRQVLRQKPDLLVVPTTRANAAEQRFLSYTDHRLIETCPCPLLLLKTREAHAHGTVLAAVDPRHAHDQAAELDETILGAASIIARALSDAAVHVCHMVTPRYQYEFQTAGADATKAAAERVREAAHLESLRQRVSAMAALHDVPEQQVHVEFGTVESGLPLRARELHAEIVVMGAVSRSLPRRPQLALTAESVLDALECDVLVVKPAAFRSPVSRRPNRPLSGQRRVAVSPEVGARP